MRTNARKPNTVLIENLYPRGSEREALETKFRDIINEELNLSSSVSYIGNKSVPFLRLYRYKEAFAYHFVEEFLKRFNVGSEDYVFDPFVGMGTTTFTSMLHGIHSIGVEKLPVAHFIAKTLPLFLFLKEGEIKKVYLSIIEEVPKCTPAEIAMDVPIMKRAFMENVLLTLRKLKTAIEKLDHPYNDIFLLLFFSILEECSFTSKDGQFLRLRLNKKIADPIEALRKKVAEAEDDIIRLNTFFPDLIKDKRLIPDIYLGDARDLSNIKFRKSPTIILTSPPYVNRYDYTRTYVLELCFHFVKNFEELKAIRFGILRSHIESKIKEDEKPNHPVIEEVVEALNHKKLNNPRIPIMLTTYFIDMERVIKEWSRVLANGAKVGVVVDNVRFEGELIPVDLVLSDIAEKIGFKVKKIIVARYKGNSSQQMKRYGKIPVRESIVIWEKT
jgi:site-specific DNA-methyltransferase (cytosine-N4-specific)